MYTTGKKGLLVLLVLMLALSMVGTGHATGGVLPPYTDCASFEELCAAYPQLTLSNVPEGAEDVTYQAYLLGDPQQFAQMMFTYEEKEYTYRAMAADNKEVADDQEELLSGMYVDFDEDVDDEDIREGEKTPFAVPAFEFEFELEYNLKDAMVNMEWYIPAVKTQYNLSSETAGMPEMKFLKVAELLQPAK